MVIRSALVISALLVAAVMLPATANAQSNPGELLFKQRCAACHVVTAGGQPGPMAPNLRGVVGRKAAASAFKNYSQAMANSKVTWTAANLDKFLTSPGKMIPGTRMVIGVADAKQRAALIAYLATQR
ncbi:MAG: c-type cytochrome [Novosphingobium sp.]